MAIIMLKVTKRNKKGILILSLVPCLISYRE